MLAGCRAPRWDVFDWTTGHRQSYSGCRFPSQTRAQLSHYVIPPGWGMRIREGDRMWCCVPVCTLIVPARRSIAISARAAGRTGALFLTLASHAAQCVFCLISGRPVQTFWFVSHGVLCISMRTMHRNCWWHMVRCVVFAFECSTHSVFARVVVHRGRVLFRRTRRPIGLASDCMPDG